MEKNEKEPINNGTSTSFHRSGTNKLGGEASRLQAQLDQFYEKIKGSKSSNDEELDFIFGKRSEKEIAFLKKMEQFNKRDLAQIQ